MKDTDTKQRFVELRAEGWSFARIAAELGVSKPTLIAWSKELRADLANLRAVRLEALRESYGLTVQTRLEQLGETLKTLRAELSRRNLEALTPRELLELYLRFDHRAADVIQDAIPLESERFLGGEFELGRTTWIA